MSGSEFSSRRRNFLRKMIALVPAVSVAAYLPFLVLRKSPAQAHTNSPPTSPFTPVFTGEEWAFLLAACACLIPADWNSPGGAA
jgi:gluconate 2-dehydrogenase gamma chain